MSRIRGASLIVFAAVWSMLQFGASAESMRETSDIQCDIRRTVEGDMVRLEALAVAGQAAEGRYDLTIHKEGASGTTRNRQGGGFSLGAGETRVLSASAISVGPRDRYEARLTIEWNGETRSCGVEG